MTEPIIIRKDKDYEGKLCWQCPFDRSLFLHIDNFLKHISLLHGIDVSELIERPEGLLKCECGSYFVNEIDLKFHQETHAKKTTEREEKESKICKNW
jgi:hypothetical protein